jgi:serine/threonine protein kinase HipA of HipAB toxin-antitoxin module
VPDVRSRSHAGANRILEYPTWSRADIRHESPGGSTPGLPDAKFCQGGRNVFDLLAVVGRTQIGRIRYSDLDAELDEAVPFQPIDEILSAKRGGELFAYLLEKFAVHSGVSGVQPKVMIRAIDDTGKGKDDRQAQSFRSATHIVKFWDPSEYPELAANEHFCLSAAKALGLAVPNFRLSDSGAAILIERFDLAPDGACLGYEDFCVLNGVLRREIQRRLRNAAVQTRPRLH